MRALHVWVGGDCDGLSGVAGALDRAEGIFLEASPEHAHVHLLGTRSTAVPAAEVAQLRAVSQAPIVLACTTGASMLLEPALNAGITDVVLLPQPPEALIFELRKAARVTRQSAREARRAGKVVTVFSPKGGTGKSVLATNLAAALASRGRRTLLVDLDLQFGDAAIMLGVDPHRTLHDVAVASGDLDAAKLAAFPAKHASGLDVLPAPLRPEEAELVSELAVAELFDVAAESYDHVVVDTAPSFHHALLPTLDRTNDLLLVAAPDVPTLKNVRLALQTLELLGFPHDRLRLVLNRPSPLAGLKRADVRAVVEHDVALELPSDPAVLAGVNRANPAVLSAPSSPYAQAVGALADELAGIERQAAEAARGNLRRLVTRGQPA